MKTARALNDTSAVEGFRALAEALPCMVWTADARGNAEWFNQDFHSYTGLTPRAAAIAGWIHCVHPIDRPAATREFAQCLLTGATFDSMVRLKSADGSYRWFSVRARPYRPENGGSISYWLGTLTDIHDRQVTFEANTHMVDALMKGYLLKELPATAGVTFDTHYRAANVREKVGGDWYDVFALPDGRIGFSLGDVCGHGIDAAVKMGEAKQAIFVAACLSDPAPLAVLQQANDVLFLNDREGSITTAIYGIVDTARRKVTYASAGHHPPILARTDGTTVILPNHGFPLGVEQRMPPRIKSHDFIYEPGALLLLYTDGLIEFDHNLVDGEARLLSAAGEALRRRAEHPARFVAEHILGSAPANDDVAVLTLSFHD